MQALVPNTRRDIFKDEKVREALNYGFDFEELNRTVAFNSLQARSTAFLEHRACLLRPARGSRTGDPERPEGQGFARCLHHAYSNPVGGDPQKSRDNLRKAIGLLQGSRL
jgi:microcin C transport system substrate-binding protein